jgi:hypothetical protein
MTDLTSSQSAEAWHKLQDLVRALVPKEAGVPQLRWIESGRLALLGEWQVQARFTAEKQQYEVHFERFGAELGKSNFEPTPGLAVRRSEVWKLEPVNGEIDVFWRIGDGPEIKQPNSLATRIVDRLKDFYQEYKLAALGA